MIRDDEAPLRTGEDLERDGLELTPVGEAWKAHLDALSIGDSPLSLMCDPMSEKLWKAYVEFVRNARRKALTPKMVERYSAIEKIASRMPGEAVFMDLLNWMWELEERGGIEIYDGDTRGIARDRHNEFVNRVLIEGKGVGS